eukprot:COSAG04_NODE_1970_length_5110_cov_7.302734_8_plen_72_part_00
MLFLDRHNHAINADCFQDTCAESVIEFNHIHDVGRQDETGLCDGGGIHGKQQQARPACTAVLIAQSQIYPS